jgi:hypothetical protein
VIGDNKLNFCPKATPVSLQFNVLRLELIATDDGNAEGGNKAEHHDRKSGGQYGYWLPAAENAIWGLVKQERAIADLSYVAKPTCSEGTAGNVWHVLIP